VDSDNESDKDVDDITTPITPYNYNDDDVGLGFSSVEKKSFA
jgi:hypothetical protein